MKNVQSKLLKIAIVSDAIYPYNKGGKEKRIFEISTRLAKLGNDVHIYCMKWWKEKETSRVENGVHLHAISPLYPLYSGQRRSIRQAILFALSCLILLKEDFDILEVDHMPHLVLFTTKLVALLKRKKLYVTWSEVWGRKYWVEYMGILGNLAFIVEWISSRLPDEITAVSEHTKNLLMNDLKIKRKIHIIPNGIDFKSIEKITPSKEKSDIIFAGRLLSHKNVDLLIKIVAHLKKTFPHIKTIIIGEGPEKHNLYQLIKKMGVSDNIKMLGFLNNHNELYSLMKSSRIFVFPSTREGFGIVALEANASGIPVITSSHKSNATKDLIMDGVNGYALPLKEDLFSERIITYLTSKDMPESYQRAAKYYDWTTLSKKVSEVYA